MKGEQSQPTPYYSEINKIKAGIADKEQEIDDMLTKFEGGGEAIMRRLIDTDIIDKIFAMWDNVSIKNKQTVEDTLIKRVLVTKETIEIVWKI